MTKHTQSALRTGIQREGGTYQEDTKRTYEHSGYGLMAEADEFLKINVLLNGNACLIALTPHMP